MTRNQKIRFAVKKALVDLGKNHLVEHATIVVQEITYDEKNNKLISLPFFCCPSSNGFYTKILHKGRQ